MLFWCCSNNPVGRRPFAARTLFVALCAMLVTMSEPAFCAIELSAGATVEKPNVSAYVGTVQMNGTWYAQVPFETTTSYVAATGGEPNAWANISWTIQIGYGPSNGDMTIAAEARGELIQFDSNGTWSRTPQLSGSLLVALGSRTARTVSEVWIPNTSNSASATTTQGFSVIAPQGGGGGGGGGDA